MHTENKTVDGFIKGTLGYLSPEQATPGAHRDQRSDVYALGALLYEILAQRKPIIGESLKLVLKKTVEGRIKSPSQLGKQVPRSLEAICMKALETDPDDRYQSVNDLIADVQSYTRGFATEAEEAGLKEQLGLFLRRNAKVTALSIIFFIFSIFALIFFVSSLREKQLAAQNERDKAVKALDQVKKEKEVSTFFGQKFQNDLIQDAHNAYLQKNYPQALSFLKYLDSKETVLLKAKVLVMMKRYNDAVNLLRDDRSKKARMLKQAIKLIRNSTPVNQENFLSIVNEFEGPLVAMIFEKQMPNLNFNEKYQFVRKIMKDTDGLHPDYNFKVERTPNGLVIDLHGNARFKSLQFIGLLGKVYSLDISSSAVTDLSPLSKLSLKKLNINNTKINDLTPLNGLDLHEFSMIKTLVTSLKPLLKMQNLKLYSVGSSFSKAEMSKLPSGTQIRVTNKF